LYGWQIWIEAFKRRARHAFGVGDASVVIRLRDLLLQDVEHGSPRHLDERRIDRLAGLPEIAGLAISESARRTSTVSGKSNRAGDAHNMDAGAAPNETASTPAIMPNFEHYRRCPPRQAYDSSRS
jgi:hypothetical protein